MSDGEASHRHTAELYKRFHLSRFVDVAIRWRPCTGLKTMGIALRWREEPFDCEFVGAPSGGTLQMFSAAQIVWQEPVRSAVVACERAREVKDKLLARRARQA
jgi:hypothetical protein